MTRARLAALAVALSGFLAFAGAAQADTRVSVGSPPSPYPRNDQDEPALAVDAKHPQILAAGANESIDNEPCTGNSCPFTPGVGGAGIYFSFNGGASWTQPTYTGWSARTGTPQFGPIGTLPWYYEAGLLNCCDASLAFGPAPGSNGAFSWANGSRLYYTNPSFNFSADRKEEAFKGFTAILVSRTDDPQTAALGGTAGKNAWMRPVIVSQREGRPQLSDKSQVWADNAESSPYFGNVYACWTAFRSFPPGNGAGGPSGPIMVSRSTDGGGIWSAANQISAASNNFDPEKKRAFGRQGCTIRTDSKGAVYVFFLGAFGGQYAQLMSRSFDGGRSFERPRVVASPVYLSGAFDVFHSFPFIDGVRGAFGDTNAFPSVDVANGAPSGADATDEIILTWGDARCATPSTPPAPEIPCLNGEAALVQYSVDRGASWSSPVNATAAGDRADMAAIAISPDGKDVYLTYDGLLDPYRQTTSGSRRVQGVVRHADLAASGNLVNLQTVHRGNVGDARASSRQDDGMRFEFFGDYNYAVATNDFGSAVWADLRNAAVCPAINAWRQSLLTTDPDNPPPAPAPATDCPSSFGNVDIFGLSVPDPTP